MTTYRATDFRSVDWHVYQRFGKLLVRLYEEEEDLSIYLIVDCSTSMGFGKKKKFDQARRLCAALAYVGLANLDRVTVVGINDGVVSRMPTTRGKGRIFKVFEFLSQLEPSGVTDLGIALRTFVAQHKRRGLAVLFSDLYDPAGFEAGVNMLRFNKVRTVRGRADRSSRGASSTQRRRADTTTAKPGKSAS